MQKLKVLGIDPALCNFGLVLADYDRDKHKLESIDSMLLVQTTKKDKDIDRARKIREAFFSMASNCDFAVAEIPGGSQSARAAKGLGIATGILACSPVPIVLVTPMQVKKATGKPNASKKEMIEWGHEQFPEANWLLEQRNGKNHGNLLNANEHLADAIAVIFAGMRTFSFIDTLEQF